MLFWLSSGLNMLWIICFSYTWIGVSALVILAFAITLSLLVLQLAKIQSGKQWLLPAAFGMYSGWLLIATVVNIASWLVSINWQGLGIAADIWGIIILIVAVVVTAGASGLRSASNFSLAPSEIISSAIMWFRPRNAVSSSGPLVFNLGAPPKCRSGRWYFPSGKHLAASGDCSPGGFGV